MIETLLIAAPPAPEPGTNYLELIGIPLLVALVTAVVTSILNNMRTRSERLAALRLETYRELILAANRWEVAVNDVLEATAKGELPDDAEQTVGRTGEHLAEQIHVLPLVTHPRATEAIKDAFTAATSAVLPIEKAQTPEAKRKVAAAARVALRKFVNTIIREGRREVRRTRA